MITLNWLPYILTICITPQISDNNDSQLANCDFSRLKPGSLGNLAAEGFPEYQYVPRQFTDDWEIVNNRGPEAWKVFESDGKLSLNYNAIIHDEIFGITTLVYYFSRTLLVEMRRQTYSSD